MDQLETQVSDLRSFLMQGASVMSPAAASSHDGYSPASATGGPPPHSRSAGAANRIVSSTFSAPGDNSAQPPSFSPGAPNASTKRRLDGEDSSAKQQRSKRNRYISIACNECKRRKIKCNGSTPCQRCGNLNLECLYAPNCCSNNLKDSDDFKQLSDQVSRIQEQVDMLFNNMTALRQDTMRLAPLQDRILPLPSTGAPSPSSSSIPSMSRPSMSALRVPSSFSGPTSMAFTVDVAKNTLHNMGYSGVGDGPDDGGTVQEESPPRASPVLAPISSQLNFEPRRARDPLWDFDRDEMIRLCRVHEEEVGIMYPVVKMAVIIEHAKFLSSWLDALRRNNMTTPYGQDDGISDLKSLQLKAIMCCALVIEEHGHSAKAETLYNSMQPLIDRMLMSETAEVSSLPLFALVAGYRFLSNDEILAWRIIGQVVRHCQELGLHRRDGLSKIPNEQDRRNAINTFWSAYVLDRRWSFGTGLPYACHDDKIDPKLPLPEEHPYLVAMISYSRLGAKVWRMVDYFEPAIILELKRKDFEDLDREILDWYDSVPREIQVPSLDREIIPVPGAPTYDLQRLQIWTRLRMNQIRIWLFTPVLHSASSIIENMPLAQKVVDLAKDTIQYLVWLNNTTNVYRRIQVFYHHFLTSAIAVLFLASTHAPLHFSPRCRSEFYAALDLIKDMSAKSWVSQRLWRTVKSLKAYAPRLGLEEDDAHSNAAMTIAGLASGRTGSLRGADVTPSPAPVVLPPPFRAASRTPVPRSGSAVSTPSAQPAREKQGTDDPSNGLRLQTEMLRVFEGFTGFQQQSQGTPGYLGTPSPRMAGTNGTSLLSPLTDDRGLREWDTNHDTNFYQHFKNMF